MGSSTGHDRSCRLCIRGASDMVEIFPQEGNESLAKMVLDCLSIHVQQEDAFPKCICHQCFVKVEEWNRYRNECQKNQEIFRVEVKCEMVEEEPNLSIDGSDSQLDSFLAVKSESKSPEKSSHAEEADEEEVDMTKLNATPAAEATPMVLVSETEASSSAAGSKERIIAPKTDPASDSKTIILLPGIKALQNIMFALPVAGSSGTNGTANVPMTTFIATHAPVSTTPRGSAVEATSAESSAAPKDKRVVVSNKYLSAFINDKSKFPHDLVERNLKPDDWKVVSQVISGGSPHLNHETLPKYLFNPPYTTAFKCKKCNVMVPCEESKFQIHAQEAHGIHAVYPCDYCGIYLIKEVYIKHWIQHFLRHKCDQCGKRFNSVTRLKTHEAYHSQKETMFSSNIALPSQRKMQMDSSGTAGKTYPCKVCDQRFSTKASYAQHIYALHKGSESSARQVKLSSPNEQTRSNVKCYAKKGFKCGICCRILRTEKDLKRHTMAAHEKEKHVVCNVCGRRNNSYSEYLKHMTCHQIPRTAANIEKESIVQDTDGDRG